MTALKHHIRDRNKFWKSNVQCLNRLEHRQKDQDGHNYLEATLVVAVPAIVVNKLKEIGERRYQEKKKTPTWLNRIPWSRISIHDPMSCEGGLINHN
jgi:hypothetical protein